MKRLLYIFTSFVLTTELIFADIINKTSIRLPTPPASIISADGKTPIYLLSLVQSLFLKVVLPIVVVGASLYIAYELFTAEGDETKMKKAWKSVAYTAIALIAIALSLALVNIVATLQI